MSTSAWRRTVTLRDGTRATLRPIAPEDKSLIVASFVRSNDDTDVAEVAVTVIDDWQGRGLGRVLLTRLTSRARQEGVRRFSLVVLGENREARRLFNTFGDVGRRQYSTGVVELVIELPPKRGIRARLAHALRGGGGKPDRCCDTTVVMTARSWARRSPHR
jgi:GNAT superfamily N-acetyltransferase